MIGANSFSGVSISDPGTNFNTVSGNLHRHRFDRLAQPWQRRRRRLDQERRPVEHDRRLDGPRQYHLLQRSERRRRVRQRDDREHDPLQLDPTATGELGIDLGGDGVTPNHVPPATSGPNNWENYPIITSAGYGNDDHGRHFVRQSAQRYLHDRLLRKPQSASGEGNRWLGSVSVTTDANGQVIPPTTFNLPANTDPGQWITATATDQAGDTSEFSNAWQLTDALVPGDRDPLRSPLRPTDSP